MIHTKVAKVLNATSVILAAGSDDGVKEGMEFVIYDLSETIHDPETGEDLGRLELIKGRVFAIHVQDRLTWAQTKSRTVGRVVDPRAGLAEFALMKHSVTEVVSEQLKTADQTPITVDKTVRVGDKVRSVYQPEFAFAETAK